VDPCIVFILKSGVLPCHQLKKVHDNLHLLFINVLDRHKIDVVVDLSRVPISIISL
jgi:hypothetical protein